MPLVTNKFGILVSAISQEPITSKNIPRVSRYSRVNQQLISKTVFSDVAKNTMGIQDQNQFAIFGSGTPLRPSGTVEVISDPVAGLSAPLLFVGPFILEPGKDYTSGGGLILTALNIATAINQFEGYTATPVGAVITVEGPEGEINLPFTTYYQAPPLTFTFTYVGEPFMLGYTISPIQPPEIL
jgi:hypothetical protein